MGVGQNLLKTGPCTVSSLSPPTPGRGRAPLGVFEMPEPSEKEIAARAREFWKRAGKPEGRDKEFWRLAEQELRNEDKSSPVRTPDTL
jgi:hypothetical protein